MGTFDGVHIGHRKIVDRLILNAAKEHCESVILTFFPHPRMVLQQNSEIKLLNTIQEKAFLLDRLGLDHLIVHPFDEEFSKLSAEEFVRDVLVDKLNICKIIIGHDHRFGKNRSANIDDLVLYGKQYGFEVEQISAQEINEVAVSSTKIRSAISNGDIALANEYLGYNYLISGKVIAGKQLGRTIGFPTANIQIPEDYKHIPKQGVYIVSAVIDNSEVYGMMNIGTNPTVNGTNQTIEIYFLNYDGNLYGTDLQISVYERLRDELKFESVEALKKQLEMDRQNTISYFALKGRQDIK